MARDPAGPLLRRAIQEVGPSSGETGAGSVARRLCRLLALPAFGVGAPRAYARAADDPSALLRRLRLRLRLSRPPGPPGSVTGRASVDRKSTRLNSSPLG